MFAEIRHNRYCDDIVGIKIKVPESQAHMALEEYFWPNDVSCRKWEPRYMYKKRWNGGNDADEHYDVY